jgi:hypothetical protein
MKDQFDKLPLIGYEYEYIGLAVVVTRVVPCNGGRWTDAHVDFNTRYGGCSSCEAGELSKWQDLSQPLSPPQRERRIELLQGAHKCALSDIERELIEFQLKAIQ